MNKKSHIFSFPVLLLFFTIRLYVSIFLLFTLGEKPATALHANRAAVCREPPNDTPNPNGVGT